VIKPKYLSIPYGILVIVAAQSSLAQGLTIDQLSPAGRLSDSDLGPVDQGACRPLIKCLSLS
jgi:hypothetical protein